MEKKVTIKDVKKAYEYYLCGPTLSQTARRFNIPRSSLRQYFEKSGFKLRERKQRETKYLNGEKYTLRSDGYFRHTVTDERLHRKIYEEHNGPIPDNMKIVFKDRDKSNLSIDNLMLCTNAEATAHQLPSNKYLKRNPKLREKIIKHCLVCNTIIEARWNSDLKNRKYCGRKCYLESRK